MSLSHYRLLSFLIIFSILFLNNHFDYILFFWLFVLLHLSFKFFEILYLFGPFFSLLLSWITEILCVFSLSFWAIKVKIMLRFTLQTLASLFLWAFLFNLFALSWRKRFLILLFNHILLKSKSVTSIFRSWTVCRSLKLSSHYPFF